MNLPERYDDVGWFVEEKTKLEKQNELLSSKH